MYYTNSVEAKHTDTSLFKIHGRTFSEEKGLIISWSNSGIELSFKGSRIEFHFAEYNAEQPAYVKAYFDGTSQRFCLAGKSPKVLLDFDKDKTHTVKLLRISEGETLKFTGLKIYGKAPEILTPPADKKLKLEFMGDSITAGFGVLAPRSQNVYTTYEQDSTKAYAYMTAELLDADIRTEAISGQGVYRNCGKEVGYQFKTIFDMIVRVRDGYDHSSWTPDVFVLNCGTNDVPGGTTNEIMYEEGSFLLDKVRKAYPDAEIIWTYGMMNGNFSDTLKKLVSDKRKAGDSKMHYIYLKDIYFGKDEVGAIGHPNVNASVRVSKKLAAEIKKILEK